MLRRNLGSSIVGIFVFISKREELMLMQGSQKRFARCRRITVQRTRCDGQMEVAINSGILPTLFGSMLPTLIVDAMIGEVEQCRRPDERDSRGQPQICEGSVCSLYRYTQEPHCSAVIVCRRHHRTRASARCQRSFGEYLYASTFFGSGR